VKQLVKILEHFEGGERREQRGESREERGERREERGERREETGESGERGSLGFISSPVSQSASQPVHTSINRSLCQVTVAGSKKANIYIYIYIYEYIYIYIRV
jgi:hypothetical protein